VCGFRLAAKIAIAGCLESIQFSLQRKYKENCNCQSLKFSRNSHYETDFGVSSAEGAGNTKVSFLKARLRWAFKKLTFIMRIAGNSEASIFAFDFIGIISIFKMTLPCLKIKKF
jgi:hypothetical protein